MPVPVTPHPYHLPQRPQHCPKPPPATSEYHSHTSLGYATDALSSPRHRLVTQLSPYQTFSGTSNPSLLWSTTTTMSITWSVHENPKARMSTPSSWTRDTHKIQDEAPTRPCSSIPLPGQVGHDVDVIPLLRSGSGLDIDLRMLPVVLCGRNDGWDKHLLRPATNPPLPSMSIVHPVLPWAVTVHRSAYEFVTVKDVMVTILGVLATPVEQMMPGEPVWQKKEREEKCTDWTRLDYLPGTKLVGLRKSRRGEDIWVMEVV